MPRILPKIMTASIVLCTLPFVLAAASRPLQDSPAKQEKPVTTKPADPAPANDFNAKEFLAADEGTWDVDLTLWFRPGAPPVNAKGVCTAKLILNGMYLEQIIEGDLSAVKPGATFTTRSYTGFNPSTRQIEVVRLSSTTPAMMPLKGTFNPDTKTATLSGEYTLMNMKALSRDVVTIVSKDERRIDSFMTFGENPEFKGSSMVLRRRP